MLPKLSKLKSRPLTILGVFA